jgi:hypothetical protein
MPTKFRFAGVTKHKPAVELNDVGVYVRLLPVGTPVAKTEIKSEWPHVAVDRAQDGKIVGIEYVPVPEHFSLEVIAKKAGVRLPPMRAQDLQISRSPSVASAPTAPSQ